MDQDQKASARNPSVGRTAQEGRSDFDARRRVLRGAVGLPAIVTLASGSAASAASILECAANEKWSGFPGDPPIAGDPYDNSNTDHVSVDADVYYDSTETNHPIRYKNNGNLFLVDPDGVDGSDPVPVVPSCYSSFVSTGSD